MCAVPLTHELLDLLDLDAQDSSSPRSLHTTDCTPITTVRCSVLCGRQRPRVSSHMGNQFLRWPASVSDLNYLLGMLWRRSFRGLPLDMAKPSQQFFFDDCVFHLKGYVDVFASQSFSHSCPRLKNVHGCSLCSRTFMLDYEMLNLVTILNHTC